MATNRRKTKKKENDTSQPDEQELTGQNLKWKLIPCHIYMLCG
jgi:hypothetical protein